VIVYFEESIQQGVCHVNFAANQQWADQRADRQSRLFPIYG